MRTTTLSLVVMLFLSITLGSAQASECLAQVRAAGVLRAGNGLMGTKPFVWQLPDGSFQGLEADLLEEIGKRLGVPKAEFIVSEWSTLIPGLKSKRWDIILSAMSATQERITYARIRFSDPYLLLYNLVIVTEESPIRTLADLRGRKVASVLGTNDSLNAHRLAAEGVFGQVLDFNGFGEPFQALKNGQVDAVLLDQGTLISQREVMRNLRTVGEPIRYQPKPEWAEAESRAPYHYGTAAIALRQECDDLRLAINAALAAMQADGTHEALLGKYGLWSAEQRQLTKE